MRLEAMTMDDRVAVISHGCILQCGPPMELYANRSTSSWPSFLARAFTVHRYVEAGLPGSGRKCRYPGILCGDGLAGVVGIDGGCGAFDGCR